MGLGGEGFSWLPLDRFKFRSALMVSGDGGRSISSSPLALKLHPRHTAPCPDFMESGSQSESHRRASQAGGLPADSGHPLGALRGKQRVA